MTNYTLKQIKAHPNFPFDDFESNPLSFLMLELYWSQLFFEIIRENRRDWASLIKADMDGNPIFCATSLSLKRQLTVVHKVNKNHKRVYPTVIGERAYYELQAWLNAGHSLDGEIPLNELVLYADLSPAAEREASNLIRLHCIELANETKLEKAIKEYEERVGMPE